MALVTRLGKGSPLTAQEMDDNLIYLESSINVGTSGVSGTSGLSGSSGTSGSGGSSGTSGVGSSGSSGSSGTSGIGSSGSSGSSGTSGIGSSGSSGSSGSTGASGTSGTSISLNMSDGTTSLSGIQNITLNGLGLNPSGSNGAEIINFGGGGGGTSLTVSSGSTAISNVSTLRVDGDTMNLANNGAGTVTIGVKGGGGSSGVAGTAGTSGTSGNSISLTLIKDITSISGIQSITLTGSIFLDNSGSNGAFLRVEGGGGSNTSGSGFPFSGSAVITGSLDVVGSVTASAYAITSAGVPTIESSTNINLTAGSIVNITSSPLRLAGFTNAQTASLLAQNGDIIYNSTVNKFVGYANGVWVQLH
jgi:hypothetical protein